MRTTEPKSINTSIATVLHDLGLEGKLKQYEVLDRWAGIVGEQIAKVTQAESMNDGKLCVSVSRSTWRNELTFLKRDLIARINHAMGAEIVKDITFR